MHPRFPQRPEAGEQSSLSSIHCIGVSQRTAPAGFREALAFELPEIAAALRAARRNAGLPRLAIVSTCHRTELYADLSPGRGADLSVRLHDVENHIVAWLASFRSIDRNLLDTHGYAFHGLAAVSHLFRVAAGLDSVVPGEAQIVAQVAGALSQSVSAHAASPALKKLFRAAIRAGERAQSSVWGRLRAANLGTAAVAAASQMFELNQMAFQSAPVAVFGAGELGRLALAALVDRGVRDVTVLNRTGDRAALAADEHRVRARPFEEMLAVLSECDAAIFAIGASKSVVGADALRAVMEARSHRPLILIDVALPRNVDPGVRELPGVRLLGIDELGLTLEGVYADRAAVFPAVERIVEEERNFLLTAMSHFGGASSVLSVQA